MSTINKINAKHSIGAKLLRFVFLSYCLVAILLTATHMLLEYVRTTDEIKITLRTYQTVFEKTLANSVQYHNWPQLETTIGGILHVNDIVGIAIYDTHNRPITFTGIIPSMEKPLVAAMPIQLIALTYAEDLFWHHFDILSSQTDVPPARVGTVYFYSDTTIAINKVAGLFKAIILFALLKTVILWIIFLAFGRRFLSKPLNALIDRMILFSEIQTGKPFSEIAAGDNEIELIESTFVETSDKLSHTMDDIKRGYTKLQIIATIFEISSTSKDIPALLETILRELIHNPWLSTRGGTMLGGCITLFRYRKTQRPIKVHAGLPFGTLEKCSLTQLNGCLCAQNAKHKEIYFVPVLEQDEIHPAEWANQSGYYAVPILTRSDRTTIGVMTCFVQGNIQDVEEDKAFLSSIGHSISSLIEHKIADEETERHQDYLEKTVQERTKQLIHAERLATLGTFSAGMAHEINNPNSFIRGNIQYLQGFWKIAQPILEKHADEDPSGRVTRFVGEIPETLSDILNGSQRISTIVDSLKKYSKGGFETDKVVCRLLDPVSDAIHLLDRIIKKKLVTVTVGVPADIVVHCDRQQMSQVFVNLVNNAMDALEECAVQPKEIQIRAERIEKHAWIRVIDNGPGIPEEAIGKIFDPFFTTKGKTKGTGLGLAIVQGIVEDHRGQVTIYSSPGCNTEVLIIFPLNNKTSPPPILLATATPQATYD